MTARQVEDPWLLFFRSTPSDVATRPPLASSLQSFESCLFLISLMRYPHALTSCASAIESALKAQPGYSGQGTFQDLLACTRRDFPGLAPFPQSQLDDLRQLRNRFVHFGFNSNDDAVAVSALLLTGLPLLISVYEVVFGFSLHDALVPPFGAHLRTAIEVFTEEQLIGTGSVPMLSALGHLIRWSFRESMMAPWERQALDPTENYDLQLEITERLREYAEHQLVPAWRFDCPVCEGPDVLVCKLDDDSLGQRRVELLACFCIECGLRLSGAARPLLNALCRQTVAQAQEAIFSDFGVD